jgi:hypothetical protein
MNRDRKGQAIVETALVLGAFMSLLFGMLSIGQMVFTRQTLAERAHTAARWGAMHPYDARSIRSLVLYGTTTPSGDAQPLLGLAADDVEVGDPGCPGPECRISVVIPGQGVRSVEPVE